MSEELTSGRRVAPSRSFCRIFVQRTLEPFVIHHEDARGGDAGIGERVFVNVLH